MKNWDDYFKKEKRKDKIIAWSIGIGASILIGLGCYAAYIDSEKCKARGGEIVGDGTYYPVTHFDDKGNPYQLWYENMICTADIEE
ncbi:hypothetical protein R1C46_26510 [Bacillus tropicus]